VTSGRVRVLPFSEEHEESVVDILVVSEEQTGRRISPRRGFDFSLVALLREDKLRVRPPSLKEFDLGLKQPWYNVCVFRG